MSVMTSTPTPSHGTRRDRLTSSLLIGAVLVVLGTASGLGIETSTALPKNIVSALPKAPTPATPTAHPPMNYIGVPGPGTGGGDVPGIGAVTAPPAATPSSTPTQSATPHPTSSSTSTSTSPAPVMSCPPDVVSGLLDVVLGGNGLNGSGLLSLVTRLLPNLSTLLAGLDDGTALHTDVAGLSPAQQSAMATGCTPVLSGLLGLTGTIG